MTIAISAARLAAIQATNEENNPLVTGAIASGTAITTTGTQALAASNAVTGSTFDPWAATPSSGAVEWQYVFDAAQTPTAAGVAAHNLADVGATVSIEYSTDAGSSWTDSGAGTLSPSDDVGLLWRFVGVSATHWRVKITSASAAVSVGVIWIGSEIIIPQRIYQGYAPPITPTIVDLNTNVSEGAQLISSAYMERGSNIAADFTYIDDEFIRGATWKAFQRRWNRGNGAFWAWRPGKYGDVFYIWRGAGNVIQPNNAGPRDLMAFQMQGRAYHV